MEPASSGEFLKTSRSSSAFPPVAAATASLSSATVWRTVRDEIVTVLPVSSRAVRLIVGASALACSASRAACFSFSSSSCLPRFSARSCFSRFPVDSWLAPFLHTF